MRSPSDVLRTAVIGVGHLGRHHARILSRLEGVSLVRVVDIRPERAEAVGSAAGVAWGTDAASLAGEVDAVTVAVPTQAHLQVALPFLERGVAVLVEKPFASSLAEADRMIEAAESSGAVLAVGHTERFNPAVAAIRPLVTAPLFIEVHRLGAFPGRSLDIDVVFDLMIHDLDIALWLVDSDPTAIDAVGVPVLTGQVDIANVRLRFASGCIANLTASRISRDRVRKIRVFQRSAYLSVDYAAQEVEHWRLVRAGNGAPAIEGGRLEVNREEPLKLELADFAAAAREGREPGVTARQGRRALAVAQLISQAITAGPLDTRASGDAPAPVPENPTERGRGR
jgi:predicted dehydrogenase